MIVVSSMAGKRVTSLKAGMIIDRSTVPASEREGSGFGVVGDDAEIYVCSEGRVFIDDGERNTSVKSIY